MNIIDFQATPSGYYQITFRNDAGQSVIVTQEGRGGCNHYTYPNGLIKDEFHRFLDTMSHAAISYLRRDYPELADAILDRENEWEDTVCMAIADLIDLGKIRVNG